MKNIFRCKNYTDNIFNPRLVFQTPGAEAPKSPEVTTPSPDVKAPPEQPIAEKAEKLIKSAASQVNVANSIAEKEALLRSTARNKQPVVGTTIFNEKKTIEVGSSFLVNDYHSTDDTFGLLSNDGFGTVRIKSNELNDKFDILKP